MRGLRRCMAVFLSGLVQPPTAGVYGFMINREFIGSGGSALGLKTNDGYDDVTTRPPMVDATSLPTWYEESLLASADEDVNRNNEQLDLQELCVIEKSFDIDQKATVRRSMKPNPKKYKQLFRYSPDISVACWLATVTNTELLESCGFDKLEIERMASEFPRLLKMDAKNMIAPKLRFLVNVLKGGSGDIGTGVVDGTLENSEFAPHNLHIPPHVRNSLPAKAFFSSRLETALGPRHAYLTLHGDALPHGEELLNYYTCTDSSKKVMLLDQFLDYSSKKPSEFAHLCNYWQAHNVANRHEDSDSPKFTHTAETVMAMDNAFCNGLVPFAHNEVTADLQTLGCDPGKMVSLLLDHGANYAEHDDWGSTVLHWAAGTGNLDGLKAVITKLEQDERDMDGDVRDVLWSTCASCFTPKDLATPLHWASAGVNHTHFGCGGHVNVCRYLLDKAGEKKESLANSKTAAGNTPFMWACWSGSLDAALVLVEEGTADPFMRNEDGYTAAHLAAASGHIHICKLLQKLELPFVGKDSQNKDGETPLDCALSYGRSNVVDWIAKQKLSP